VTGEVGERYIFELKMYDKKYYGNSIKWKVNSYRV
jgi:hypothetical protein